jgi:hypothetical protein
MGCLTDRALAAGDSPAGAREVDDSPCPPGHNHSASLRPISAHQLQAHVRPRASPANHGLKTATPTCMVGAYTRTLYS